MRDCSKIELAVRMSVGDHSAGLFQSFPPPRMRGFSQNFAREPDPRTKRQDQSRARDFDLFPHERPEMDRHGRVRFVNEDCGAGKLMQLAKTSRLVCSESFKKLHGGRNNNGRVPERGKKPEIDTFEFRLMVMGRNNLFRVLSGKYKGLPVHIYRLLNDIRVWQNDENMSKSQLHGRLKKVRHDRGCFSTTDRAITSPDMMSRGSGTAGKVDL